MVKGMKQTEIGMIPEDWEYVNAEVYIDFLTGFPFQSDLFSSSGTKLLRGSNVKRNFIDWSENLTKYWNQSDNKLKAFELAEGDIVISMDGSLVGKSFGQICSSDLPAFLVQRVARVRGKNASTNYLKYLYCSEFFTKHCDNNKTASAIPHISPKDIKEYKILIPKSLPEQEAIAGALSDADAWIESLEQLIAKKRLIKQGAMQKLLTPKEGWEVKKLGEVCAILNNLRIPIKESSRVKGDTPYYGANGIQGYIDGFTHFGEFVLVAEDGANDLSNYPVNFVSGKIWVNNHAHVLQGITSIIGTRFLSYLLKSIDFQNVLVGGTRAKLNKSILEKIELKFPSLTEQTRIATILSDMDAELEALEQQLHKARQIKQGMMQELLTGRIRLEL